MGYLKTYASLLLFRSEIFTNKYSEEKVKTFLRFGTLSVNFSNQLIFYQC